MTFYVANFGSMIVRILYFIFLSILVLSFAFMLLSSPEPGGNPRSTPLLVASIASSVSIFGIVVTSLIIVVGSSRKREKA